MPKGFTLWFTGLSGSGKTTLSQLIKKTLIKRNCKVEIFDGDIVRTNLSKGLGFSKEDRDENIRRIGFVCHLLTRNDVVAISAVISPYKAMREFNRKRIGNFVEIFCECDLDTLVSRDPKGLYKKAMAGEIQNFTGVNDPYEPPENAEVVVNTAKESTAESHDKIIRKLEELGYLEPVG